MSLYKLLWSSKDLIKNTMYPIIESHETTSNNVKTIVDSFETYAETIFESSATQYRISPFLEFLKNEE
jgi:hypothetical protein